MSRYSGKEILLPIDEHIGKRIRLRRQILRMTQKQFADLMSVTFQQVQKYELGKNRISAGRLWNIAQILKVPTDFFFAGLETRPSYTEFIDPLRNAETLELVCNYYKINNRKLAQYFFEIMRELAHIHIPNSEEL